MDAGISFPLKTGGTGKKWIWSLEGVTVGDLATLPPALKQKTEKVSNGFGDLAKRIIQAGYQIVSGLW